MAKILIVDDERGIGELIKMSLEENGHEAIYCENGAEAKNSIFLFKPAMIISDIKMSPMNGIELLHWVKNNYEEEVPFVFITGFSDILLFKEAIDLGAFSLIRKPFNEEDILSTVDLAIGDQSKYRNKLLTDDDFCRIDLKRFVSGSITCCSIYVKIRDDHFVKIAEKNDPLPVNKLKEYKERKLEFLYVLKDEFGELVGFNMRMIQALNHSDKIPKAKILNFINYSNGIILEQAFAKNLSRQVLDDVRSYSSLVLDLLSRKKALFEMLINLKDSSSYLYAHSFSTAVLSYLIAKEIGWNCEPTLCRVFLAGLLHDIGLREIEESIVTKNGTLLTDVEFEKYKRHSIYGMEILNQLGDIPDDVILATYQHHEFCDGSGYPQGLKKNKISPISKLISVADLVDNHPQGNKNLSLNNLKNLVDHVLKTERTKYDQTFLEGLAKVLSQ
jgi:HD-GYP domain-containing protein (c-di-GMP phosphodiesterase class II)/CheY-like chemotaxis protein